MKLFDRDAELGRLESLLRCKDGGLAVLWGRRRVGKSRLLLEWCRRSNGLYTVADASAEAVQRRYFAESLAPRFPSLAEAGGVPAEGRAARTLDGRGRGGGRGRRRDRRPRELAHKGRMV